MRKVLMCVAALLCWAMACPAQTKHAINWSDYDTVEKAAVKLIANFNRNHAADGLQIEVNCLYTGPKSYVRRPEKHVALTAAEVAHLNWLRGQADSAFDAEDAYEQFLIGAHQIHAPKIGDVCWCFVGIKVQDDFITVDPNPLDPDCEVKPRPKP